MEPISLSIMTACAGKVLDAVLGDSAPRLVASMFGGIIGNRTDALICRATASSWGFFKNLRTHDPVLNHDLERGTREAYLLATLELVRQAEGHTAAVGYGSFVMNAGDREAIANVRRGIESDLKTIANVFPEGLSDAHLFLVDANVAPRERLDRLRQTLRAHLDKDFVRWLGDQHRPEVIDDLLDSGWTIEGPANRRIARDWYSLVAIAFVEKLKTTPRLAAVFEAKMLAEIAVREPKAAPIATFAGFTSHLEQITVPLQRIEDAVGIVGRDVIDIKQDVRAIREVLVPLGRIPRPVRLVIGTVALLGIVTVASDAGTRAFCKVPGFRSVCGRMGIGGVPSANEEVLWSSRAIGDCEKLRNYIALYPRGAYATEASRLLSARREITSESWQPEQKDHVFTVRSSLEPWSSEQRARSDAMSRAQQDAETVCAPYRDGEYKLISAQAVPTTWRCARRSGGIVCGFDGKVECRVRLRRVGVSERCD